MSRPHINQDNTYFKTRYGREPKTWTITQVHDLWVKASARFDKLQKEKTDYISYIVNNIPANDSKEHIVYFYNCWKDGVYHVDNMSTISTYTFFYEKEYKYYSIRTNELKFADNTKGREDKIDFILSNDKCFEMGQKYHEIERMRSNKHYIVHHILWEMVEDELRKHFKDSNTLPPDIFVITISGIRYNIQTDPQHRYGYMKFHWKGITNDICINM